MGRMTHIKVTEWIKSRYMDVLYSEMFSDSVFESSHEYKKIHRTPE